MQCTFEVNCIFKENSFFLCMGVAIYKMALYNTQCLDDMKGVLRC